MTDSTQNPERFALELPSTVRAADNSMFRDLVELLNCVVVILRPDRTVAYLNAFAEQFTGHSAADVSRSDLLGLLIPESAGDEVE